MADLPKLAVIIACYNYEQFVERAIHSVLGQDRDDCELVVIDDGSTDDSWAAICRTGAVAFRIPNSGQLSACRYGLSRTRAAFVLFLDADDELKPGALDRIIELLDPAVAKLQFSLSRIDGDGRELACGPAIFGTFRDKNELARQVVRSGVYKTPPTSGNVFRRDLCELLEEVDYEQWVDGVILFAAPFVGDIVSTSEQLGYYRIHGSNDSALDRPPQTHLIERDISRFLLRMEHLSRLIEKLASGRQLVEARDTFFFRERSFYLEIASCRRPKASSLPGLLARLLEEPLSLKRKAGLAVFFVLAWVSPVDRANALLSYRGQSIHRRSVLGFARVMFCRKDRKQLANELPR